MAQAVGYLGLLESPIPHDMAVQIVNLLGAVFLPNRFDEIHYLFGQIVDRNLGRLVLDGAVYVGLERPDLADHEYRRHQRRAVMLPGVRRLRQIEQALQLERRDIDVAQFAALQKPVDDIECR